MAFKIRSGEEIKAKDIIGVDEEELKSGLNAGKEANTKLTDLTTKVDSMASGFDSIKAALQRITANGGGNNNK